LFTAEPLRRRVFAEKKFASAKTLLNSFLCGDFINLLDTEHELRNFVEHLYRAIRYNLFCSNTTKKYFRFYPGYAGRRCWFAAKEVAERTNNNKCIPNYKRFSVF